MIWVKFIIIHTNTHFFPPFPQPGDVTLAVGMIAGGSGLMSFQHRRTPDATTHLQHKEANSKINIRNTISDDYRTLSDDHVSNK